MTSNFGSVSVYLEIGAKRMFACAYDWPGWCRSGKTEEAAIESLASYLDRYREVARIADLELPAVDDLRFDVVERVTGAAGTTDFGAPGAVPARDRESVTGENAGRQARLVRAAWELLDRIAAKTPDELRKGPRGGGRNRDRILEHILGAEASYARTIGVKHRQPAVGDTQAIAASRSAIADALRRPANAHPVGAPGWPTPYAARRIAWHVLDHAWEMEDRTER